MSREAHTPGPWKAADKAAWFRGQQHPDDGKIAIQPVGRPGTVANAYGRENANLIAAAPALFDFAKALDASWTETFPDGPDAEYPDRIVQIADEHRALWRQCRAAIQSATGEG